MPGIRSSVLLNNPIDVGEPRDEFAAQAIRVRGVAIEWTAGVRSPREAAASAGGRVIVRSFRGVVVRGGDAAFYAVVRDRLRAFRQAHAMVESHVGRRTTPLGDHFLITTYWPDWESLHAWAGDDIMRPWGFEELMPYLASWEIEHFEELDLTEEI